MVWQRFGNGLAFNASKAIHASENKNDSWTDNKTNEQIIIIANHFDNSEVESAESVERFYIH